MRAIPWSLVSSAPVASEQTVYRMLDQASDQGRSERRVSRRRHLESLLTAGIHGPMLKEGTNTSSWCREGRSVLGKFMPDRIRQRERLFASDHVTNDGTDFSRESKPGPLKGPFPLKPLHSLHFWTHISVSPRSNLLRSISRTKSSSLMLTYRPPVSPPGPPSVRGTMPRSHETDIRPVLS